MKSKILAVVSPTCADCRAMRPDLERLGAEFADTVALRVISVAEEPEAARALGVMATPTLVAMKPGSEVFRVTGRRSPSELAELFRAAAAGAAPMGISRNNRAMRIGTGVTLLVAGALLGPAWPLVAVGSGITGWGLIPGARRRG